jgi:hypothetical protein
MREDPFLHLGLESRQQVVFSRMVDCWHGLLIGKYSSRRDLRKIHDVQGSVRRQIGSTNWTRVGAQHHGAHRRHWRRFLGAPLGGVEHVVAVFLGQRCGNELPIPGDH